MFGNFNRAPKPAPSNEVFRPGKTDEEALEALHRSVELGINFFDTAWIYGNGHSEQLLGKLLKSYPNKHLYTSTKIPPKSIRYPMEPFYKLNEEFPPDHINEYVHKSMKNMGLEKLDLRKDIETDFRKNRIKVNEIRMREIGFNMKTDSNLKLKILEYDASKGKEFFLEFVNNENILFGLLRLRLF